MASESNGSLETSKQISGKDLKKVEICEEEQNKFKDWFGKRKDLSGYERAALNCDSVAQFNILFPETTSSKYDFDREHDAGCGLGVRSYQMSASSIIGFMDEFSPILDIVKNFAAPYGGIAVGTISILFAVAKNKNEMEESLASAIASIQARLPGLKLYQHIYNDDHELSIALQSKIVSAYQLFIDFCIVATKYYKCGGARRWLKAMKPSKSFADLAKIIEEEMINIRKLCEELLDRNVDTIKRMNIELKKDNIELKAQIKELQKGHDHDRLNEIQTLLNLSHFSSSAHKKEWLDHVHAVDTDDQLNAEIFQRMCGPALATFEASEDVQSWSQSLHPCLLILSGYNNEAIRHIDHCWLSPIASTTVSSFAQKEPTPIHAYYVLPPKGKLLYDVLPVLLLQLLRQKSHVLRDEAKHAELCTELRTFQRYMQTGERTPALGMNEQDRVAAMEWVALRVLDFFDSEEEEVYVIVDRADRCRDGGRGVDHRKGLLKALVKMVEAARCRLRVLVVVEGGSWRMEGVRDELGEKMKERVVVHTAEQGLI